MEIDFNFVKKKMDIIAGIVILLGTALGIWANQINKNDAKKAEKDISDKISENSILVEKNKKISAKNLELNNKLNRYAEEDKYFNKKGFGFLNPDFPYGYTVIKENKENEDFTRVFGSKPFNIDFKSCIFKKKNGKYELRLDDIVLKFNNSKFEGRSVRGEIDVENFGQIRLIFSVKFISKLKNMSESFRIGAKIIDRDDGFNYAIGIQKDDDPSQLSQLIFDLDKSVTKRK